MKEGITTLNPSAVKLEGGASELNNGLQKLSANSAALNKGAETVFNSLCTGKQPAFRFRSGTSGADHQKPPRYLRTPLPN